MLIRQEDKERLNAQGLDALTDLRHALRLKERIDKLHYRTGPEGEILEFDDSMYSKENQVNSLMFRRLVRFLQNDPKRYNTAKEILRSDKGIKSKLHALEDLRCPYRVKEDDYGRPLHKATVALMHRLLDEAKLWVGLV